MRGLDAAWLLGLGAVGQRLVQSALSFSVTPQNTLVLAVGGEPLTLAVTAPASSSGGAVFAPADLLTGPVGIVPPGLEGQVRVGDAVSVRPGIWAHGGDATGPTVSWQWRADGADLAGATQATFTPGAGQTGAMLSVVETAADASGLRQIESAAVEIAA